jgi:3-oxoacyl-[acyl-carrier protein] reductase
MLLEEKIVFITGASKGIGRATALVCAKHGALLAINGRNEEQLVSLANEIEEVSNTRPLILSYDVTNIDEMKKAFQLIHREYKRLDVLVNNAGMLYDSLLGFIQPSRLEEMMAVNLNAVIYHMQYAARLMLRQKSGSIINVSSIFGCYGEVGQVAYSASKAAVIGATKSAAKELASANIRVNAVAPGFIDTDMTTKIPTEKFEDRLSSIKMGRIGQPEEVANAILFLASDLSSYITGQIIGVDGGMVI